MARKVTDTLLALAAVAGCVALVLSGIVRYSHVVGAPAALLLYYAGGFVLLFLALVAVVWGWGKSS
jgi:hypothetical protein